LPWALCAWPLTLLVLLVAVARVRGRGIHDEEINEAAIATTMPMSPAPASDPTLPAATPAFATPASLDAVWGSGEWGGAWGATEQAGPATPAYPTNGVGGGDPWRSSW
jgi:hypothetical protein